MVQSAHHGVAGEQAGAAVAPCGVLGCSMVGHCSTLCCGTAVQHDTDLHCEGWQRPHWHGTVRCASVAQHGVASSDVGPDGGAGEELKLPHSQCCPRACPGRAACGTLPVPRVPCQGAPGAGTALLWLCLAVSSAGARWMQSCGASAPQPDLWHHHPGPPLFSSPLPAGQSRSSGQGIRSDCTTKTRPEAILVGPIKRKDPTAPQQPPSPRWDWHPTSLQTGCGAGGVQGARGAAPSPSPCQGSIPGTGTGPRSGRDGVSRLADAGIGSSWIGQQQIFPHFFLFPDPTSMEKLFCYFGD